MGVGSSSPGKQSSSHRRAGGSYHHRNAQKSSWSQAHLVSDRPAAPTNLNVSRALGTARNNGKQRHQQQFQHPKTSNLKVAPVSSVKPMRTTLQQNESIAVVVQANRNQTRKSQPKLTKKGNTTDNSNVSVFHDKECGVCGHIGHTRDRCHHRHNSCYICNRPGHLASVCTQKSHYAASRYRPRDQARKDT